MAHNKCVKLDLFSFLILMVIIINSLFVSVKVINYKRLREKLCLEHVTNTYGSPDVLQPICSPKKHIYLVKIPKTGGSTLANILHRFTAKHKLILAPWNPERILEYVSKYDVFTAHRVFNETDVIINTHNDTNLLSLIRHPYKRMKSFMYFEKRPLYGLDVNTAFGSIEFKKSFYEGGNVMAKFLGLDEGMLDLKVKHIQTNFELILINEQYDEGLVMLKRTMCWDMKDILYLPLKPQEYPESYKFMDSQLLKSKHRDSNTSYMDYYLYDYFLNIFEFKVSMEESFQEELQQYQDTKLRVTTFCDGMLSYVALSNESEEIKNYVKQGITINASQYNDEFNITGSDCVLMTINLKCFQHMIMTRIYENMNLPNFKDNTDYIKSNYNSFIALNLPFYMFSPCNEAQFNAVKYMHN